MNVPALNIESPSTTISEDWSYEDQKIIRNTSTGIFSSRSYLADVSADLSNASRKKFQDEWDKNTLRPGQAFHYSDDNGDIGIIDLFSGCGGFSLGVSLSARAAGIRPRHALAVDIDEKALSVYRRNFQPRDTVNQSVADLIDFRVGVRGSRVDFSYPPEIVSETLAASKDKITAVIGGPPCQGHSNFNNKSRRNDPRNSLYLTLPAVAVALNAPLILIENVPDVVNDRSDVVTRAARALESEGYKVDHKVIGATGLGLPQTRRRHIFVASSAGQPNLKAAEIALNRPLRDVKWAIGDLCGFEDPQNIFNSSADISEVNQARIDHLFDKDLYELPDQERPDCHKDGHTYPSVYGRLSWKKPAGTITTGFLSPGRGRFTHPSERRGLTPHEAARLQGFPDSFQFLDEQGEFLLRKQYAKLIGEAVPPVIGHVGGLAALATLEKRNIKS